MAGFRTRLTSRWVSSLCVILLVYSSTGCAGGKVKRTYYPPDVQRLQTIDEKSPFLKAHLQDGSLIVFSIWEVLDTTRQIKGVGETFGADRTSLSEGSVLLDLEDVAVIETNVVNRSTHIAPLAFVTGASVAFSIFCMTNPKACFGSCPTFYVHRDGDFELVAEGFSSSVAPCLEREDTDAVGILESRDSMLSVAMKNEALETHIVRKVDLTVFPLRSGQRVFATPSGSFERADDLLSPAAAFDEDGCDWAAELRWKDGNWRSVPADSSDLAAREEIILEFDQTPNGPHVFTISARQSLLTTFLFYQTLAWMGKSAGEWMARLETGGKAIQDRASSVGDVVGQIDVWVEGDDGGWVFVGSCGETGPLATDTWALPVPATTASLGGAPTRFKLVATKGLWRIDRVALGRRLAAAEPVVLSPTEVWIDGERNRSAMAALTDSALTLVSLPGDEFDIVYTDPILEDGLYEVFVVSQGYYWEWMRDEWLEEEDPAKLIQMLWNPRQALVDLAPEFKAVEADMERSFWGSKYVRP